MAGFTTILNGSGLILSALAAFVIAYCSDKGVYVGRDGSVALGGQPPDMPNEEKVRRNRWRYKKNTYGAPIGWILFGLGFIFQVVALISGA